MPHTSHPHPASEWPRRARHDAVFPHKRGEAVMRQFVIAAAMALGLVALWALILPLTAQPAPKPATASSPALSKALFLCRGPNGIDRTCTSALARALVSEQ